MLKKKKKIAAPPTEIHVNVSLFLIICILNKNFCAISFNRSRGITILRTLRKNTISAPFSKLYLHKLYQCHLLM